MANIFVSGKTSIMAHVAVFEAYRMDVGTGTCTRQQGDFDLNVLFANINKVFGVVNNESSVHPVQQREETQTASLFLEMEMHREHNHTIDDVIKYENRNAYNQYMTKTSALANDLAKLMALLGTNTPYNTTEVFLNNAKAYHMFENMQFVFNTLFQRIQFQAYADKHQKLTYASETDHGAIKLCRSFINSVNILETIAEVLENVFVCLNNHAKQIKMSEKFSCNIGPTFPNYVYGDMKLNPLSSQEIQHLQHINAMRRKQLLEARRSAYIAAMIRRQKIITYMKQVAQQQQLMSIVNEVKQIMLKHPEMNETQLNLLLEEDMGLNVNGTKLVKAILAEDMQRNTSRVLEHQDAAMVSTATVADHVESKTTKRSRKLLSSSMESRSNLASKETSAASSTLKKKSKNQMKKMQNMMAAKSGKSNVKTKTVEGKGKKLKQKKIRTKKLLLLLKVIVNCILPQSQ